LPTREYLQLFISAVDEDFTHKRGTLQAYFPLVSAGFILIPSNLVWYNYIRSGVPADTVILEATLVITADFFAISLLLTMESSARLRRIYASAHFKHLRKFYADPLMLMALVRIRASMPKGVTLKLLYDSDPSSFGKDGLIRRALEPLP
jgi:hypothetical protein